MGSVTRFEDLVAWQKARSLTKAVYALTHTPSLARDFGLKNQLQRATVSVMSNIAEGFERSSSAEFHQFLMISKSSCAEVRSLLYVALDVGYVDQTQFDQLFSLADETARIIGALRVAIERRKNESRRKE